MLETDARFTSKLLVDLAFGMKSHEKAASAVIR